MTVVDVDGVTFGYGPRPVVADVSLTVEAGEFLGLVGPNGSGKSTLIALLLGLRRPDSGSVDLFGEPAHEFGDGERVGYVAQNAAGGDGGMPVTVREAVRMGRYPRVGVGRFADGDRAAAVAGGPRGRPHRRSPSPARRRRGRRPRTDRPRRAGTAPSAPPRGR